jgi:N-acyl-L-homoserine lactone synthetase
MITILTNGDKEHSAELFDQMFKSRALVFHERLRWKVTVKDGWEIDRYDNEDPVYLLSVDENGRLQGSLRLLPTTGPTMLQNEFADFFTDSVSVSAPTIWECTRLCIPQQSHADSRNAVTMASTKLLIGLCELCMSSGVEFVVGVYDASMPRIYRRIGWSPELLARSRPEIGDISVGLWEATPSILATMKQRLAERTNGRQLLAAE